MQIFFILCIPIILALSSLIFKKQRSLSIFNAAGYFLELLFSGSLLINSVVDRSTVSYFNFIYLDALSVFFIFVISIVAFASALYSIGYIKNDVATGIISERKARMYYLFFNLFCFSMFFVPAVNNLGMLWVGVEMTTLISAFLVGFYNKKDSVEAAWKYIIICSVGIILALLGTILFSFAFSHAGLGRSLNWADMALAAGKMDKNLVKIAFLFILVGYGTKAGLAPMHTWLPDAHSQAVSPISALLSGVLLKTAIYAILRFGIITVKAAGFSYFSNLLIIFGLVSLAVSSGFILVQKDLKRLLAYSSIEHVGVIAIGFGLGPVLGTIGALLHVFNHAVTKSLMFFGAGNIISVYNKHNINGIRGVLKVLPFTGVMMFLGMFALTGFPPFSIFISEMLILIAAFLKGSYLVAGLMLLFLVVIFAAFIHHFSKMLFGNLPRDMKPHREPLSIKMALIFLFLQACVLGAVLPFVKKDLIWIAQRLLQV